MSNRIFLVVLYSVAAFSMFAILRYVILFIGGLDPNAPDNFIMTRVFLSAPFLIIIGSVLFFKFKKWGHKVAGVIFASTGLIWAILIIKTIIEEAA